MFRLRHLVIDIDGDSNSFFIRKIELQDALYTRDIEYILSDDS